MSSESSFVSDFRQLLSKHGITAPRFAHGSKTFDSKKPQVLYSGPVYGVEELIAATSALVEGKWSVAGENVQRFEREFGQYIKQSYNVMVNSGSSADLLMVAAAKARFGWKDGDGVIVSPVGFPTTISAITLNGLRPIFVDIEWTTLNADNNLIRARFESALLSSPIRAIFVSPVLGNPPDMEEIQAIAAEYDAKVLLDGCDSLGSKWAGKHLSEYAVASSCSFFPAHHISTLQGGMISSNDSELIQIARSMGSWGKGCYCSGAGNLLPNGCCGKRFSAWLPDQPDLILDHRYVFTTDKAYNTQPLDLQGALGVEQMKRIEKIELARRVAYKRIKHEALVYQKDNIEVIGELYDAYTSWFGVPIVCSDNRFKTAFVAHLEKAGIQTRHAFGGHILRQPGYAHLGCAENYPNADQVLRRVFFLGTNPAWTEQHFEYIKEVVKSFNPPIE